MSSPEQSYIDRFRKTVETDGWRMVNMWSGDAIESHTGNRVAGVPKGFPDKIIVGHGRSLFVEFKSDVGRARPAQEIWMKDLLDAGVEVFLSAPDTLEDDVAFMRAPALFDLPMWRETREDALLQALRREPIQSSRENVEGWYDHGMEPSAYARALRRHFHRERIITT